MRCEYCDLESDWEEAFRRTRKPFSFQELRPICPKCWETQQASIVRWTSSFALAMSVLQILLSVTIVQPGDYAAMLAVGCFLFFLPVAIVLHEMAHAVAAVALGLRLFAVSYGMSRRCLVRRRFLNCDFEIRALLTGGFTRVAPRSTRWLRLRWGLMLAAAPFANALLAMAAFAASPKNPTVEGMVLAFAWANLISLAASLFPWKHATPIGAVTSDGLALLTLPFASEKKVREKHVAFFVMETMAALREKNYQTAIAWAEKGQREYPGEINNRCMLGVALLGLDRFVEARNLFLELAAIGEPPGSTPPYQAVFLNNVAWTDVMTGDPPLLDEADQCSARAMRLTPWMAEIKGTRGMVLVTLGRTAEGLPLLEQSMKENEEKANKALNACYLAIGFKNEGNLAASQRLLEQARKFDPECSLLPRVLEQLREGPKPQAAAENSVHPQMVGG